MISRKQ